MGTERHLQQYFAVHNGKLMRNFENLYDALHIAGYSSGLIYNTTLVKDAIKAAKDFIDKFK
ncbi:MAG: DUF5618 family protein [Candidatus Brocadia sp.]|jgi:hypothetical protein